jgi:hypothetical protein
MLSRHRKGKKKANASSFVCGEYYVCSGMDLYDPTKFKINRKPTSIVRVRIIVGTHDKEENLYASTRLWYFSEFVENTHHPQRNIAVHLYPYKLWQIQYLIEYPAFYIERFLYRNLKIKETKKTHIATLILASIFDGIVAYYISKIIDHL